MQLRLAIISETIAYTSFGYLLTYLVPKMRYRHILFQPLPITDV